MLYVGVKGVQGAESQATVNVTGLGKRTIALAAEQSRWAILRLDISSVNSLPQTKDGVLVELRFLADKVADFRASTGGVDPRVTSVGVLGFMICKSTDVQSRLDFVENLSANDLGRTFLVHED